MMSNCEGQAQDLSGDHLCKSTMVHIVAIGALAQVIVRSEIAATGAVVCYTWGGGTALQGQPVRSQKCAPADARSVSCAWPQRSAEPVLRRSSALSLSSDENTAPA